MNKENTVPEEFDVDKIAPIKSPVEDGRIRLAVEFRIGSSGELNLRLERIELLRKELAAELKDLSSYIALHPIGISLNEE